MKGCEDVGLVGGEATATRAVKFNDRFLAFAACRGFRPRACAPYRARTRGKDERGVGYVKGNAIAGHRFESWAALEARSTVSNTGRSLMGDEPAISLTAGSRFTAPLYGTSEAAASGRRIGAISRRPRLRTKSSRDRGAARRGPADHRGGPPGRAAVRPVTAARPAAAPARYIPETRPAMR